MIIRSARKVALAAALCLSTVCVAAAPLAADEQEFSETVDVDVVNLEVVVTDRQGQPVTGLTRDDFEVFADGSRIELSNFFAARGEAAASVAETPTEKSRQPSLAASRLQQPADGTRDLFLVIFVDQLNIGPQNRKLLFEELRRHLRSTLGPGSRVMVVSMGSRMEVPLQPTEDVEEVFAVLRAEEDRSSLHQIFDAERRQYLDHVRLAKLREYVPDQSVWLEDPDTGEFNLAETEGDENFDVSVREAMELAITARTLAERRTQKVRASIEALGGLCDQLGPVPGRKALLYLSDGLPLRPALPLLEAWTAKFESWAMQNDNAIRQDSRLPHATSEFQNISTAVVSDQYDLADDFERLTLRASENRVVFYPISNSGRGHASVAASRGGDSSWSGGAGRDADVAESLSRDAALLQMADDTGGVAMLASGNLASLLDAMRRDFEDFYSLGFRVPPLAEGTDFHKLEVKVKRDGLRVRHVKGYREGKLADGGATRTAATTGAAGSREGAAAAPAASPAAFAGLEDDGAVSEVVDVRVANVEVVVTDRDGQPIQGLTRDDFEIYENGRRMELTNFYAVDAGSGTAPASDAAPEARPADVTEDRHLILFVDNSNIRPQNRKLLFENLRGHLREHAGWRTMVVSLDPGLEVALPFTRDADRVLATLDDLERRGGSYAVAESARRLFMAQLDRASLRRFHGASTTGPLHQFQGEGDPEFEDAVRVARNLADETRTLAQQRHHKVETTLEALGSLCDVLGGIAGRKALVYLSDGLPLRPADSLIEAWVGKYEIWFSDSEKRIRQDSLQPEAADLFQRMMSSLGEEFDLQSQFNRLTTRASDNRVAFYPISTSGRMSEFVSAAVQGNANLDGSTGQREAMVVESFTRDDGLMRMAEDTGGVAVLRNANLGALLDQVERDFSSFYSLGYSPPPDGADRLRRLDVKVLRPGARVRHIKGFRTRDWRRRLGDMTTAAALFAVESNPLGVQVAPGEVTPEGDGFRVPIIVKIPFQHLRLVHRDQHFNAQVTLLVMVGDAEDSLTVARRFDLPIKVPDSRVLEALAQVAAYPVELTVPKGSRVVAVGVRDHLARTESTVMTDLFAGGATGEADPAG